MKSRIKTLTPRHREILRLLSLGCGAPEIAKVLKLALPTVVNHRTRMMKRLGIDKVALLTRVAIQYRISPLGDKLTPTERRRSGRKLVI